MQTSDLKFCAKVFAIAIAALCLGAQLAFGDEKPDAPVPKIEALNPLGQGMANPSGPRPVRDGSSFENWVGLKRGFRSFETPDNAPPLTPRQKYVYALYEAEDLKAHVGNVFQAAIQQGFDAEPHYGQGWEAYAQRFGAAEADQVTSW